MALVELAKLKPGGPVSSEALRVQTHVTAAETVKHPESPYRELYDKVRHKYADALHEAPCVPCGRRGKPAQPGTPLNAGHQHACALHPVETQLLKDLWAASKRLHEQQHGLPAMPTMTMDEPSIIETHCLRCLRPNPDDVTYPNDWEAITDADGECIGISCPACLTPGEERWIADNAMDLAMHHCARCGRKTPRKRAIKCFDDLQQLTRLGWQVITENGEPIEIVCPSSLLHDDDTDDGE